MKKVFLTVVGLLLILVGCASEKEKIINDLKSNTEGKYNVVVFKNDIPSEEFQRVINETFDLDREELWEGTVNSFNILDEIPTEPYDYEKALDITQLPEFIVLDTKGIILRTNDIEELEGFLMNAY